MLILIGIVPNYFSLNEKISPQSLAPALVKIESVIHVMDSSSLSLPDRQKLRATQKMNQDLMSMVSGKATVAMISKEARFEVRKKIVVMDRNLNSLIDKEEARVSEKDKKSLQAELSSLRKITDYSPRWAILLISLSLGIGTMIGWKRIVKTIGEKIGKEHLTYAQGASAELVAASTIGLSTYMGLPVSTTHVLSSGIAGSMVASKGVKNLQPQTVRNILIAWLLTLPVVMVMAGTLFLLFRSITADAH
jgi:PiT family inorganic phosphate transporter